MDTVNSAPTDEERSELVKDNAQQIIDSRATKAAELAKDKAAQKPAITDTVAKAAVEQNRNMSATIHEPDGTLQTVDIKSSNKPAGKIFAQVEGLLSPLQQTKDTCWAAVAAMMASWRYQTNMTIENAVRLAGDSYADMFRAGKALEASERHGFIDGMGMVSERGGRYLYTQYVTWMKTHGPIWVTVDSEIEEGPWSLHAMLLIRIEGGDGFTDEETYFTSIDPSTAQQVRVDYATFRKSFEQALTDADPRSSGLTEQIGMQIIHYPEDIQSKEGYALGFYTKPAVHENLVLQALRDSTFALNKSITVGSDPSTNEFLRGVFWNDDPAGELFDIKPNDNFDKSGGVYWGNDFAQGKAAQNGVPENNIIGRSHFGVLQFLHAMASVSGEAPSQTFAKVMMWAEIVYKLSIGQLTGSETLSSVTISNGGFSLSTFFNANTRPTSSGTLKDLIAPMEIYTGLDLKRRALGSFFHLIQDSFAKGHTQRKLLNPTDQIDPKAVQGGFKPGTWGHLGEIEVFHTYLGQGGKHAEFDQFDVQKVNKIDDWDSLWGARDAIAQSVKLADFWKKGTKWEDGVQTWAETECFKVSATASPAKSGM